mgnify:CR=1 FL=1
MIYAQLGTKLLARYGVVCTEKIIIDKTAPTITGAKNGDVFCGEAPRSPRSSPVRSSGGRASRRYSRPHSSSTMSISDNRARAVLYRTGSRCTRRGRPIFFFQCQMPHIDFASILSSALTPITLISGVGLLLMAMSSRYAQACDRVRENLQIGRAHV